MVRFFSISCLSWVMLGMLRILKCLVVWLFLLLIVLCVWMCRLLKFFVFLCWLIGLIWWSRMFVIVIFLVLIMCSRCCLVKV